METISTAGEYSLLRNGVYLFLFRNELLVPMEDNEDAVAHFELIAAGLGEESPRVRDDAEVQALV